jgi:predicted RNA polymerase sigma factor
VRGSESAPQEKKTMHLFVVGGLSYTELALRFLSNDPAFTYRVVIA